MLFADRTVWLVKLTGRCGPIGCQEGKGTECSRPLLASGWLLALWILLLLLLGEGAASTRPDEMA